MEKIVFKTKIITPLKVLELYSNTFGLSTTTADTTSDITPIFICTKTVWPLIFNSFF